MRTAVKRGSLGSVLRGLLTSLVAVAAAAQSAQPATPPQDANAQFREMLCGGQGLPPTSTEIPTIGCFGVPGGSTAAGMFDGRQFVVAVGTGGEPKCRFDGAVVDCGGCVGLRVPHCPVMLVVVSHNADRSVSFSVQRRADGDRYLFRIDTWNRYLALQDASASQAAPANFSPGAIPGSPVLPEFTQLSGKNAISGLTTKQDNKGDWIAEFDYYYSGEPKFAALRIELTLPPNAAIGSSGPRHMDTSLPPLLPGRHHVSAAIAYPGSAQRTRQVTAKMLTSMTGDDVIVSQRIEQVIDWPTFETMIQRRQFAENSPQENLDRAVQLIDSESAPQLSEAKAILEHLIGENAQFDAAYVELARIAMRSNWGPEGLHQAESLLSSALQIKPTSVNAKILLGYVYSHQNRFAEADALFSEAAASHTRNLWLWTNWGELLAMQGKVEQAAAKYRRAVTEPMTHDTYDRARAEAYRRLLALLQRRQDLDGMETLYKQRIGEFGPGSCYSSDYARFKLQVRGDTQGAIDLARGALNQNCEDSEARQILGLAEYVKWADSSGEQRAEALNQARVYLPAGPMPMYLLAKNERTVHAAKALTLAGEQVDQRDNDGLTALAHALQDGDLGAAQRLLALGARADTPIGLTQMPVALLPVMEGNVEAVRMLRQSGVDYSKLSFRGTTAIEFARQSGNSKLLDALGQASIL